MFASENTQMHGSKGPGRGGAENEDGDRLCRQRLQLEQRLGLQLGLPPGTARSGAQEHRQKRV